MQMVGLPDDPPAWMELTDPEELHVVPLQLERDPYFLDRLPIAKTDLSEEKDPSEDVEDSEDEGII